MGMGVLRDAALAPYAAYQPCRARGMRRRSLLGLLLEVGAGCHLEASARKNVGTEVVSYSQAGGRFSHSTLGCLTWVAHSRSQSSCAPMPLRYVMRRAVQSSSVQGCIGVSTPCVVPSTNLCSTMGALRLLPGVPHSMGTR